MARRLPIPYFKIILSVVALYWVGSFIFLLTISLPPTQQGLQYLQQGEKELLQNPEAATILFNKASQSFEESSNKLQQSPFLVKVLAILPPFRWQVHLLQASNDLAIAGKQASGLVKDFPTLTPEQPEPLEILLEESSNKYFEWYNQHRNEALELNHTLDRANTTLTKVPNWILLADSRQLRELKTEVHSASQNVGVIIETSDKVQRALGSEDSNDHVLLVGFTYPSTTLTAYGNPLTNYLLITGRSGSVHNLQYAQTQATNTNTPAAFFPEAAEQLATHYSEQLHKPVEAVALLDAPLFDQLLTLSGPIKLTRANSPSADKITGKPQLLTTPYLAELLSSLIDTLSRKPDNLRTLAPILGQASTNKTLQIWSKAPQLQEIIRDRATSDASENNSNWLKVVSEQNSPRQVTLTQVSDALNHTLRQKIAITGTGKAEVYLPESASNTSLPIQIIASPHTKRVSLTLPTTLEYDLPYTEENLGFIYYIKQAGLTSDNLQVPAFGYNGTIGENILLTK